LGGLSEFYKSRFAPALSGELMSERRELLKLCEDRDPLFPVQAFFNSVSDMSFLYVMMHISKGVGFSSDYCHCRFPGDFEPHDNEPTFDGVQFSLFEDTVAISYDDFANYFDMDCQNCLARHPSETEAVHAILTKVHAAAQTNIEKREPR
jgi:CDI immunity protein